MSFMNFFKKDESNEINKKEYKLSDLNTQFINNIQQLKNDFQIAVIDDNQFEQAELLKNNNFKLSELGDIKNINMIESFPIIVCDIHGVGTNFDNSGLGGAFLISQIRKNYPDKYIIAYSTHANDLKLQKHTKNADYFMPVPSSIEQWTEALEKALENVGNPVLRWKKFRNYLLQQDMELGDIYKLEQYYIRYLKEPMIHNDVSYCIDEFTSIPLISNSDFKDVLKQFAASTMVEIGKNFLIGN